MMRALWTAGTGLVAQQANMDVISNNLANVNTTGFKKGRAEFQDLMYQTIEQAGAATGPDTSLPTGIEMGHGAQLVATKKIFTVGSLQATGNQLDMSIDGDGFFQITMPDGTLGYTRDGAFNKDSQGRISNANGYLLEPAITIPKGFDRITIADDGTVSVSKNGTNAPQVVGQIQLARFINPAGLSSMGNNMYGESAASGNPTVGTPGTDGAGKIKNQFLEMSNVQVVEEMVNMIVAQRAYEINTKAIQSSDEMLSQAAQLKR